MHASIRLEPAAFYQTLIIITTQRSQKMSWQDTDQEATTIYKVVSNHEEQYSIWAADRENPLGWNDAGKSGLKAECLEYITEVWTDMRPLSLRRKMEEATLNQTSVEATEQDADTVPEEEDIISRLSKAPSPVEVSLRPEKNAQAFKERIDQGHVHLRFTETRGTTELGVKLDRDATNLEQADFEKQTGTVHLEGGLTLNYVKVRCIAEINLGTLAGHAQLERV
jgi:uncharacterized protein YbdZ (MbtH family)